MEIIIGHMKVNGKDYATLSHPGAAPGDVILSAPCVEIPADNNPIVDAINAERDRMLMEAFIGSR